MKRYEEYSSREEMLADYISELNIPTITGKSEKQIAFAVSTRTRVLYDMMWNKNEDMKADLDDALWLRDDPEGVARFASENNMTVQEYMDSMMSYTTIRKFYTILTTGDAKTLLDILL